MDIGFGRDEAAPSGDGILGGEQASFDLGFYDGGTPATTFSSMGSIGLLNC